MCKIIALKEMGKPVSSEWDLLRNKGNHKHNQKVVSLKKGELLVVRRPKGKTFCSEDYTPCPSCKGWFLKSAIRAHYNYRCPVKGPEKMRASSIMVRSVQNRSTEPIDQLDCEIFPTMRNDEITEAAKTDELIRKAGLFYLRKHSGNRLRCRTFARKHIRAAASLLVAARRIDNTNHSLDIYLTPQKFEVIQKAAINLAGGEGDDYTNVSHPSTLKNIGYEVKHLVEIKEENAIIAQDAKRMKEAEYFLKLYQRKWTLFAGSAQKQLEERMYNKAINLPSTEDVEAVTNIMKNKLVQISMNGEIVASQYVATAELVQARLLVFNKRRPGELEALR